MAKHLERRLGEAKPQSKDVPFTASHPHRKTALRHLAGLGKQRELARPGCKLPHSDQDGGKRASALGIPPRQQGA